MSGLLVYSERDELAHNLLAWAAAAQEVLGAANAVVLGAEAEVRADAYRRFGPRGVYVCPHPELADLPDDTVAAALTQIVELSGSRVVLIGATRRGRSVAPRLAQRIGAGCVTDAVELSLENGQLLASRYALGGNTLSREKARTQRQVVSVMPGAIERAEPSDATGEIISPSLMLPTPRTAVTARKPKPPATVDISASRRVVCVGRGIAKREDLQLAEDLAKALDAEIACTRPLSSEYGWVSEERMIGISGETCSPDVLISLGISGQVQHTMGIVGSKTIVAINNDATAPIFKLADYGVVGDLYQLLPALTQAVKGRSGK